MSVLSPEVTPRPPDEGTGVRADVPSSGGTPPPTFAVAASRGVVLLVSVLLAVVGVYGIKTHAPENVLDLPAAESAATLSRSVLPQGWAFFTRSPREENLRMYPLTASGTGPVIQGAVAEPANAFGFDRGVRAQGTEMAILAAEIPADAWIPCEESRAACLDAAVQVAASAPGERVEVTNPVRVTTVCGPVVAASESTSPWAYRDLVPDPARVSEYALLEVSCP